jgi:hypothetical protein
MQYATGNIWDYYDRGFWAVIPTNHGWNSKGYNVMGRGLAKQAADKFPDLPRQYGASNRRDARAQALMVFIIADMRLIMFPTKALNLAAPHLSWKADSTLPMIEACSRYLREWIILRTTDSSLRAIGGEHVDAPVAIPLVGCGEGRLNRTDVLPILERYFGDRDDVVLVERK